MFPKAVWWRRRLAGAAKNQIPRLQNVFHARIFSGIVYFDTTLPEFVLDFLSIHS
jgi:hypothetical protein